MSSIIICPNCRTPLTSSITDNCLQVGQPCCERCMTALCSCRSPSPSQGVCVFKSEVVHKHYVCRHCFHQPPSQQMNNLPNFKFDICNSPKTPECEINSQNFDNVQFLPSNPFSPFYDPNFSQSTVGGDSVNSSNNCSLSPSPTKLSAANSPTHFVISRSNSPQDVVCMAQFLEFPDSILIPIRPFQKQWTREDDQRCLDNAKQGLKASGWYYGQMTWQRASSLLTNSEVGTFLVRDSSSKTSPYALSVQTNQGPTSVRIEYEAGNFWLDCERKEITVKCKGVIELVEHYRRHISASRTSQPQTKTSVNQHSNTAQTPNSVVSGHVWKDHVGKVFGPIEVRRPLKKEPSSLKHLCRVAVNSNGLKSGLESIPKSLQEFLQDYSHSL